MCKQAAQGGLARAASSFAGPRQRSIEERLTQVFAPTHLEVLNESHGRKEDESHFKVGRCCLPLSPCALSELTPLRSAFWQVIVVSSSFEDTRLLARHRAVNSALLDEAGELPFHSLSIGAAKTPAEWDKSGKVSASPKCQGGDGRGMKL